MFEKQREVVGMMHRAGVPIMAGTDTPGIYLVPGFALHDELRLLVDAGLTPLEAIQAATLNPARFLNTQDRLGTIENGKLADMVLLDANPLDNIENTRTIAGVMAGGRFLSKAILQQMLAGVEATASRR